MILPRGCGMQTRIFDVDWGGEIRKTHESRLWNSDEWAE